MLLVKALDMVRHLPLLDLLTLQGAPASWTREVQKILTGRQVDSRPLLVHLVRGMAQGSSLSSLLFVPLIDPLLHWLRRNCEGVSFIYRPLVNSFVFANYVIFPTESFEDVQNMYPALSAGLMSGTCVLAQ